MTKCDLCGQDAGLFRKRHKECETKHNEGINRITLLASDAALGKYTTDFLQQESIQVSESSFINHDFLKSLYIKGFEAAIEIALEDNLLTEDEESHLTSFVKALDLHQDELDNSGAYSTMVKAAILREITEGKIPTRVTVAGEMPFNFQKSEKIVWLFNDVEYYEQRTTTRYEGGYRGASIKIAKGIYYRTSGFRGNPVPVTNNVKIDIGMMVLTQKHIYFSSTSKTFRIRYNKIIGFTPYSDGIGVQRDGVSAKPQIFVTGDGWFTYNAVSNLAKAETNP